MTAPVRIQRQRTKGWKMPPNTVNVTRPGIFGNPFPADVYGARGAVDRFRRLMSGSMSTLEMSQSSTCHAADVSLVTVRSWIRDGLPRLAGRNLACWCKLGDPCHADVLLELASAPGESAIERNRRRIHAIAHPEAQV
jgi:hypothetical protein